MDTNDMRAKLASMDAILTTQAQAVDAWWECTQTTMRLLHQSSMRHARLTRELLAAAGSTFREIQPSPQSAGAMVRLATLGWQTTQDMSRDYTTLAEELGRAVATSCHTALAGRSG